MKRATRRTDSSERTDLRFQGAPTSGLDLINFSNVTFATQNRQPTSSSVSWPVNPRGLNREPLRHKNTLRLERAGWNVLIGIFLLAAQFLSQPPAAKNKNWLLSRFTCFYSNHMSFWEHSLRNTSTCQQRLIIQRTPRSHLFYLSVYVENKNYAFRMLLHQSRSVLDCRHVFPLIFRCWLATTQVGSTWNGK